MCYPCPRFVPDQYTFFPCEFVAEIVHRDFAKDALTSLFGEGYFRQLKT